MNEFDVSQVMRYLPHRYPFLLVDRILEYKKGESLTAIKNVTINEPFFQGHFPHYPVMPGVLVVEALAQACGILAFKSMDVSPDDGGTIYLVGVDKARFRHPVEPGDQLRLNVTVARQMKGIWKFNATAYVGDELCVSAEIMSTYKERTE
ncbi:MAG: 3-hydroxyacyl-ACP dehydratase FabZ [Acidiferrobacterales bacterium]|nr:3-hydroxyacyl-ACP dehydratase FabZ [Acidiferrobacterales bacterium]